MEMEHFGNTQENDGEELFELSLAVAALLGHIGKLPKEHLSNTLNALSSKVREEILKERLHVRRLQGENESLRTYLDYRKQCHLKEVKKSEWRQKVVEDVIKQNNLLKLKVEKANELLVSYETTIKVLETRVRNLDWKCKDLQSENCKITDQNERLEKTVLNNAWSALINPLQIKLQSLNEDLKEREGVLQQKDQHIQSLKMREKEIQFSDKNKTLKIQRLEDQIRHQDLKFREIQVMLNKTKFESDEVKKRLADRVRKEEFDQMIEVRGETCTQFDDNDAEKRKDGTSGKTQIKHLKLKLEEHERYIKGLEDMLNKNDTEINEKSNKLQTLESVIEEERHSSKQLQIRKTDLRRKNTSLNEKIQVLEAKLKQSNLKLNDLEEQLDSMRNEIFVRNRRHVNKVNGKDRQLSELNDQLKQVLNQLHEEKTKHGEKIKKLEKEKKRLVEQIEHSALQIRSLEQMLNDKNNEIVNRNEQLESTSLQEKDYQIAELNFQLQLALDRSWDKEANMNANVESRKEEWKHLESDVGCTEKTVNDVEKMMIHRTNVQLSKMINRNEVLEKEMKKKDAEIKEMSAEVKTLQQTETKLDEIIISLKTTIQNLEADIKHRDLIVNNLESNLRNLRTDSTDENKKLLVKVNEQNAHLLEQKEQLEQAFNLVRDKETECSRLQEKNQSLEEDVRENIVKPKDNQISELKSKLQHALKTLDDKEAEIRNMDSSQKKSLQYLQSEIESREEKITSTKDDMRQMRDKSEHLEEKMLGKDSQLCNLNDQLNSTLKTQGEKENELGKTITLLRNNNSRLEKEIESRERKIKSLEDMLDSNRTEIDGERELILSEVKKKEKLLSDQTDQLQKTLNQWHEQEAELRGIITSLEYQNKVKDDLLRDLRKKFENKDAEMIRYETSQRKKLKDTEAEADRRDEQISKLEGKLRGKEVEMANICCSIKQLEKQVKEKDELLSKQKYHHDQTLKQMQEGENYSSLLKKEIQHLQTEIHGRDLKINNLEKMLHSKTIENTEKIRTSKEKDETIANLKDQLRHTLTKLHDTETELDETKTRLSKAMGDRLTDNNPNITDLSDRNRPTKLAERCAELYDNQWTDAFDILDKYFHTEEDVIAALLQILQDVITFCKTKAHEQMEELGCALEFSDRHDRRSDGTADVRKALKDCRKAVASVAVNNLYQMYVSHLSRSSDENLGKAALEVKSYSKECLEICWFMMIQDPPVVFAPLVKKGSSFNTDLYKPYTSSGTHVDFVVWPPLLLHEGGPILAKGVAQGYGKKSKKET